MANEKDQVEDEVREEAEEEQKEIDYKEQMLRLAAEFDNYKKRVKNDIDSAKGVGKAETLRRLLPVLDEFELALISAGDNSDKTIVKGLEMVYSNFLDALKKEGLKEMKTNGMFDPYKHEIIMAREESKKKPGTILEVIKKGYMFNDAVLRPASVIIAKEKIETETKTENEKQE